MRVLLLTFALAASALSAQDQAPTAKPFSVRAHRYAFEPARIEVNQDDLVRIELRTDDIAHSLTIDSYRIAKRVGPGQPVTVRVPRGSRRAASRTTATCKSKTAAAR